MESLRRLVAAVGALARRRALETELDDELRFHVDMETARNEAAGMSPAEAKRAALIAFGGVERHKEAVRDGRGLRWLEAVAGDVRYALRGIRLRPALATAVVLLLALGLGANAAIFGVVDRLLLRPPAGVRDPGRLGRLHFEQTLSWAGLVTQPTASYPLYGLLRDQSRMLAGVAAYTVGRVALGRGAAAQQVTRGAATASLFQVLGVAPRLGRVFTAAEDRPPAGTPVAVLSDAFWRREFGGDRSVLGRVLRIGATWYTVVGVLPPGFSGLGLTPVDVWTPVSAAAAEIAGDDWYRAWGSLWLTPIVRLRPGTTAAAVEAEATGLYRRALAEEESEEKAEVGVSVHAAIGGMAGAPETVDPTARAILGSIVPGRGPDDRDAAPARVSLWLAGVALLVLIIACMNVASLLLARALKRRREIAVRLALGVSRSGLVRQLVVETLLLAILGGGAGLLLAFAGGNILRTVLLPGVDWQGSAVNGRVLALTGTLLVLASLLAGLLPALQSTRFGFADALRSGQREGTRRSPLRATLVVVQAALTVILLVGAGLFVRSLRNVQAVPRGFDPLHVLVVDLGLERAGYPPAEIQRVTELARERLLRVPGVREAAIATSVPFASSWGRSLAVPGLDSIPVGKDGGPYIVAVSPEYFRTMGTRIVAGRGLGESDREGSARVAVVSLTMARSLWPGQNPLGKCLQVGGRGAPCTEVVGVAENALRQSLEDRPVLQYYVPLTQKGSLQAPPTLLVRTSGPAQAAAGLVHRSVQDLSPDMPYADARPLEALIDPNMQPWRLGATMFTLFGALALVVAGLGLYGVVAYDVAQRTPEMAIRMAMGAPALRVMRLVVRDALRLAAIGLALGSLAALAAGRAAAPLLFHESPGDPAVFASVALLLLLVGLAAAALPALRASRVAPATALRAE